ncbi:thioredoxin family protein [Tepidibacter thalassicus]|uniref:Thioredoxin n=1 Tax=Tepidibacter thalassicus DSM 15285 TaxID=1123350 RepID=A0A1M5T182_9FIRM|nr:thioredoxin family protein [Tepidibacter thalassicus]SHH44475.1 Thioredoxin [Tepidibacter thalassicus DSM 15285]
MLLKDLFFKGLSFDKFLESAEEVYRSKMEKIKNSINMEKDLVNKIKKISKKIYILVFAEAWCPDCQINLPGVSFISDLNENIDLRIVSREGNDEAIKKYRINGKPRIPIFVIMDENFNELGVFIELPTILKEIIARGNETETLVSKRKYKKGEYVKDTINDVLKIIGL